MKIPSAKTINSAIYAYTKIIFLYVYESSLTQYLHGFMEASKTDNCRFGETVETPPCDIDIGLSFLQ